MMMMKQVSAVWLLLLSSVAAEGLFGFESLLNRTDLIPEWLPGCVDPALGLDGVFTCLEANVIDPTCISAQSSAFGDLAQCVSDAVGVDLLSVSTITSSDFPTILANAIESFQNISRDCLDPFVDCVSSTIQERIVSILEPTCLPGKMANLTACAQANGASCQDTCQVAWSSTASSNPWENLDAASVATCSDIQTEVVDPSCAAVTCCEACVPAYEELMDCLVNDVLNITSQTCDFMCTMPTRHRHLRQEQEHHAPQVSSSVRSLDSTTDALECLQTAPGLTGTDAAEFASRIEYYIPCVTSQFADQVAAAVASNMTDGGSNNMTSMTSHDWDYWNGGVLQDLVPEWLPGCFSTNDDKVFSFLGLYNCLQDNADSSCFTDSSAFSTLGVCVTDILADVTANMSVSSFSLSQTLEVMQAFSDSTRECLSPFSDCVNATIQERIVSVLEPTCLPGTLSALETCAQDNAASCNASCADAWIVQGNMLETALQGLDDTSLTTCSGIQSDLVTPSCTVVTCCEPCVPAYEDLMDCMANEILNVTQETCDFTCSGSMSSGSRRQLLREHQETAVAHHRVLADSSQENLLTCLQYAPGLTGSDTQELATRAPYFIPCINAGVVTVIAANANITTNGGIDGADGGTTTSLAVMPSSFTQMILMAGSLFLCLFL